MSHKATAWAIEQPLPSLQKLVLIMLSDRHNKDTGQCDPSIPRIADDCGMSKDAVRNAIAGLTEKGLVSVVKRHNGEVNLRNFYILHLEVSVARGSSPDRLPPTEGVVGETDQGSRPDRPGVVGETDQGSRPDRPGVVGETDPNHVIKPCKEPGKINHASEPVRERPELPALLSSVPFLAEKGIAQPVAEPDHDRQQAVLAIICAHPRALLRSWMPREVPYLDQCNCLDAIDAEMERAKCSSAAAAEFILARVNLLAEKIPRAEWKYLKPPADFFRLREYRMEPEEFMRTPAVQQQPRNFVEEAHAREKEEIRAARARRAERG